ncbi:MAG: hypothetical protein IPJ40_23270 [Saprospirales bacterium]|nr:hypothetical protein [Saprospirales bacterium]
MLPLLRPVLPGDLHGARPRFLFVRLLPLSSVAADTRASLQKRAMLSLRRANSPNNSVRREALYFFLAMPFLRGRSELGDVGARWGW